MSEETRWDRAAELSLIAAGMESRTARDAARSIVYPGDFYDPRHQDLWEAMSSLDRHGKKVDHVTVRATLGSSRGSELLLDLVTTVGLPDMIGEYAAIVRGWSVRRQIDLAAMQARQDVYNPDTPAATIASQVASRFIGIRDGGQTTDDMTALTARELLEQEDDEPQWLIPSLLERRDRLILTGEEGLGKSHMLRQIACHFASGLDPFHTAGRYEPGKALIIDCENSWPQVRRKLRPALEWVGRLSRVDPLDRLVVDCLDRIDITRDRDLARIHRLVDAVNPDLVVIGPLYRLTPRALQTDDEAVPVLAALDTIRDRGCALLMEAHAGHAIGKGGVRDLRPRGSSALLGWPEFGYGMRAVASGIADLVPWRGNREEREWPQRLVRSDGFRWMPHTGQYEPMPA